MDPAEFPKAELLTVLPCPYTEAAPGALDKQVELSNMLPVADVAGGLELEVLWLNKLAMGFDEL